MYARERGSLRLWRVTGGTLLPWMTLVALWRWFLNGSVKFLPSPKFLFSLFYGAKNGF